MPAGSISHLFAISPRSLFTVRLESLAKSLSAFAGCEIFVCLWQVLCIGRFAKRQTCGSISTNIQICMPLKSEHLRMLT